MWPKSLRVVSPSGVARRQVAAGVAAVVGMAAVSAAAGAFRPQRGGTGTASDPRWVADVTGAVLAVTAAGSLATLGYAFWPGWPFRRHKRRDEHVQVVGHPRPTWADRVVLGLAALVLVASLVGAFAAFKHMGSSRSGVTPPRASVPSSSRPAPRASGAGRGVQGGPGLDWWVVGAAVGAAGVAAVVAAGLARRRRPVAVPTRTRGRREEVREAVDQSLDELVSEPDSRRAVIAAYARMERLLQNASLRREQWETPFEYLDRVLVELGATAEAAGTLTELFEWAKFAPHPVTVAMKQEALDALMALRESVQAAA